LETAFREWIDRATPEEREEPSIKLKTVSSVLAIKESDDVAVFIHCVTVDDVHFVDSFLGTLRTALEDVFSALLKGRRCEISDAGCRVTNYNSCLDYFYRLLGL
jgi:hypothetical protein